MAAIVVAACLAGCALTSKSTPADIRYFAPEITPVRVVDPPEQARPRLRLGKLGSSANLRARIVHRESSVETGEYETLRWTENPEAYVRRSLTGALFAQRFDQATGGAAPTLDVEVIGFEAVHRDAYRGGRVALRYQLRDEQTVLASDVIVVEREAAGPEFDKIVVAIGAAMEAATAQLATAVAELVPAHARGGTP